MTTWLITGANGNLGKRLIETLLGEPDHVVRAVVRSERARASIEALELPSADRLEIRVLSYTDVEALTAAAQGCDVGVHLVGILKESSTSTYRAAHEESCAALVAACRDAGVGHITYLSIVGSAPDAQNACLASKGAAEKLLLDSDLPTAVIRVPMVLGEGDYASKALYYRAIKPRSFTFRAASLEQPLYAGDVVDAIMQAARLRYRGALDLGGPESLSRRATTERAAAVLDKRTQVISLPIGLGYAIAWVLEKISADPPFTRAMLGVLDHDDHVDSRDALSALEMTDLTPLDEALARVLAL